MRSPIIAMRRSLLMSRIEKVQIIGCYFKQDQKNVNDRAVVHVGSCSALKGTKSDFDQARAADLTRNPRLDEMRMREAQRLSGFWLEVSKGGTNDARE
jgi:hypothetical protein